MRDEVITPMQNQESSWLRVYCPLGMADLFRVIEMSVVDFFLFELKTKMN